jgi:hypothetical protein
MSIIMAQSSHISNIETMADLKLRVVCSESGTEGACLTLVRDTFVVQGQWGYPGTIAVVV